ncbi:MAG: arginine--tRNA ligase [Candidatus Hydrogenedentes bacterium]|nr:arginine--tRNA ligase [Candidatus Hydrogenedentota bacterium]
MHTYDSLAAPILAAFPQLTREDLVFAPAPKVEIADVALRTFEPAKKLGMAPPRLAAAIQDEVTFGADVVGVTLAGPYVNFKLDRNVFGRGIAARILADGKRYGSNASGAGKRALVEHTSINPNASPHVGRARNAMIGDSLVRLLRFEDFDVEVHYYVNDIGRQIALLVLACDDPSTLTFDEMLNVYAQAHARSEQDSAFAEAGFELLAKIEQGDAEVKKKFYAVTELCLQGQLAVLARLGIRYDRFDRESDFVKDPRLDAVLAALREKDALFEDEEKRLSVDMCKIGYPQHPDNEHRYLALLRSTGSSMYVYRDMAYTIEKMSKGADLNLIVLGEDHKVYMQQIALMLAAAGMGAPEPIYYSYILLKEGKMSTRQGKVVLLSDFLDEATARAAERVDEQCKDLDAGERKTIAERVAVGAIRFAILRVGANKNVIFDWDASLSFTGDTGPYVQYSCARISSILRKLETALPATPPDNFPVETDAEWALLSKLAAFPDVVANAAHTHSVAPIAQFALETARAFTTFYHECPVRDAPTEAQRIARGLICSATRTTLENALHLLGITALERM